MLLQDMILFCNNDIFVYYLHFAVFITLYSCVMKVQMSYV
jgi:hypothetical protein